MNESNVIIIVQRIKMVDNIISLPSLIWSLSSSLSSLLLSSLLSSSSWSSTNQCSIELHSKELYRLWLGTKVTTPRYHSTVGSLLAYLDALYTLMWCDVIVISMKCQVIWCDVIISYNITWHHIISYYLTSYHIISLHHIMMSGEMI